MFMNRSMLDAKGFSAPTSMDELLKLAVALKSDEVGGIAMRAKPTGDAAPWTLAGFVFSYGGAYVTRDGKSGIYDWKRPDDFVPTLRAAVSTLREDGVFMCHPGHVDAELVSRDPMQKVREVEYAFLASDTFGAFLAANDAGVRGGLS